MKTIFFWNKKWNKNHFKANKENDEVRLLSDTDQSPIALKYSLEFLYLLGFSFWRDSIMQICSGKRQFPLAGRPTNFTRSSVKKELLTEWWKHVPGTKGKVHKYYWQMYHLVQMVHTEY